MVLFVGDQNQVIFIHESGNYAHTSGLAQWIGLVQSSTSTDSENIQQVRYVGGGDRNVDIFVNGPLDHEGTISFLAQDLRFMGFAMGSIVDRSGLGPGSHLLSETNSNDGNAFTSGTNSIHNPFLSFTIEDSYQGPAAGSNFIRTMRGCMIDTYSISASEGGMVEAEMSFKGESNEHSSGAVTAVTATTDRPLLWQDVVLNIPSGTKITELKSFTFSINNNLNTPHYLTGSRGIVHPIPLNREYELAITINSTFTDMTKTFYANNFRSGTIFNVLLEITDASAGAGSRDYFISMSGCRITDMDMPTPNEDVDEATITIIPQTVSVIAEDTITFYNIFA